MVITSCAVCKKENIRTAYKFRIKSNDDLVICTECLDDVYSRGMRQSRDIVIVPIKVTSFKNTKKHKIFVAPNNYIKDNPKIIAFYRPDLKSISHISIIKHVIRDLNKDKVDKYIKNIENEKWVKKNEYMIINLDKILELHKKIIRNDHRTIQNRIYITFEKFSSLCYLSDIFTNKS